MADQRYEVRVSGRLSPRARETLAGLDLAEPITETGFSVFHHAEGLREFFVVARALGLRVVSVRQASTVTEPVTDGQVEASP